MKLERENEEIIARFWTWRRAGKIESLAKKYIKQLNGVGSGFFDDLDDPDMRRNRYDDIGERFDHKFLKQLDKAEREVILPQIKSYRIRWTTGVALGSMLESTSEIEETDKMERFESIRLTLRRTLNTGVKRSEKHEAEPPIDRNWLNEIIPQLMELHLGPTQREGILRFVNDPPRMVFQE